jgi:hypothetical protein
MMTMHRGFAAVPILWAALLWGCAGSDAGNGPVAEASDRGNVFVAADAGAAGNGAVSDAGSYTVGSVGLGAPSPSCSTQFCDPGSAAPLSSALCGAPPPSSDWVCRLDEDVNPTCMAQPVGATGGGVRAACSNESACSAGLACFASPLDNEQQGQEAGYCGRVCCPSGFATGCGVNEVCILSSVLGQRVEGAKWGYCASAATCSVLDSVGSCGAQLGTACYIVDAAGKTACLPQGHLPAGARCDDARSCAPGHVCAGLAERTCKPVCALGASCAGGGQCVAQAYSPAGTGVCSE